MLKVARAILCESSMGAWIGRIPGIQGLYRDRIWARKLNLFFGVFDSYQAARVGAPSFDTSWYADAASEIAKRFNDGRKDIAFWSKLRQPSVFPVCLWLAKLLRPGDRLVDFGGGGAETFREYVRYKALPKGALWQVYDLPEVVDRLRGALGDALPDGLEATDQIDRVREPDILISCGCLQYMDISPTGFLDLFAKSARHVIVNKVPFCDGPDFFTLQNLGTEAVPYRVFNRSAFVSAFEAHGYRLVDEWQCPELSVAIPFEPDRMVDQMSGMVFENREAV